MHVKNSIALPDGTLYYMEKNVSLRPLDIHDFEEIATDTEWADDAKYISIRDPMEATFECDLEINREWTLVYCRNCRSPFPIIEFDALIYGRDGWTCPLCTMIARARRRRNA